MFASRSVLDLATVASGADHGQALRDTIRVAQEADRLGFERFWVAEHHGMPGIASSAPAVLIGAIAAATERIRVGSGGVMLPNHSSLVIAEQFGTLVALHGDRIDLGLGRAPGTDGLTTAAVRRGAVQEGVDDFPNQVLELLAYFGQIAPLDGGQGSRIVAVPGQGDAPAVWLLGSSDFSARLAGMLGLPFAFAHHFAGGDNTPIAFQVYRDSFEASPWLEAPRSAVAVAALVADDAAEARRRLLPSVLSQLRMRHGVRPGPAPTQAEADAYDWSAADNAFVDARIAQQAIGDQERVDAQLEALQSLTGADEVVLSPVGASLEDRLRTVRALAPLPVAA